MKKISKTFLISLVVYVVLVGVVFANWFSLNPLSGGDWEYYFAETISQFPSIPSAWSIWFGSGFGVNLTFFMNIHSYFTSSTSILHNYLGMPWIMIERVFWFWPYIIVSSLSAFYLFRLLFPQSSRYYALIASGIYLFNTYSLMLVGGGQMGVALSYAIAPLTFASFVKLNSSFANLRLIFRKSILFGLIFSFQLMLDIRIAYVTLLGLAAYFIWCLFVNRKTLSLRKFLLQVLLVLLLPAAISLLLHLWWVLPFAFSTKDPISSLGDAYINSESVKFFSFSSFSHSLSLLQPNWPENQFGKTGFLKSEFLVLPILAFSALLFVKKSKSQEQMSIIFFVLLGLLGVFLAKGANPPFGEVYLSLFNFFPGFYMFRDPTKWYVLIALCYSVLIPYSVSSLNSFFRDVFSKSKARYVNAAVNLLLLSVGLYLIFPALTGQLTGTFMGREVPREYINYKNFIIQDQDFSRVLWLPQRNRYAFYNSLHPNVDSTYFFKNTNPQKLTGFLKDPQTEAKLSDAGIGYVVLPSDPYGEIFLADRKYSQKLNDYYKVQLNDVKYLELLTEDNGLVVYKTKEHSDLFSGVESMRWTMQSMTEYTVQGPEAFSNLIYITSYDPDWKVSFDDKVTLSKMFEKQYNSFYLSEPVEAVKVTYAPQKWVGIGLVLSAFTLAFALLGIFLLRKAK